jgi:diacylglycerol kinase family enzyme
MKIAVVMNASAGSIGEENCEKREQMLREAFADAGVEVTFFVCNPESLTQTAKNAAKSGVDAVVAAGGDGTVSAVAAALVGGQIPLGVLPLGTLNHFAQDIGISLDIKEAAQMISAQNIRYIDVGEVNGRVFINNSSIGLYPEIVVKREAQQRLHGSRKWWAMAIAARRVLRRFPLLSVRVKTPERTLAATTPFVFIGNNEYLFKALTLGKRAHLDSGVLSLYLMRCKGRFRMFWLMVRAILQGFDAIPDFETETVTEADVSLGHRRLLKVAADGEVWSMVSPLHYRIRANALPVLQ